MFLGKHGACKCNIVAKNIFTGKRLEEVSPSQAKVKIPIMKKSTYEIINIDDEDFLTMIHVDTAVAKEDLRASEEEKDNIRNALENDIYPLAIVQHAMGNEAIMEVSYKQ